MFNSFKTPIGAAWLSRLCFNNVYHLEENVVPYWKVNCYSIMQLENDIMC